jgi:hypothetical protein
MDKKQLLKNAFTPVDPEIASKALQDHFKKIQEDRIDRKYLSESSIESIDLNDIQDLKIREKIIKLWKKDRDKQIKERVKIQKEITRYKNFMEKEAKKNNKK